MNNVVRITFASETDDGHTHDWEGICVSIFFGGSWVRASSSVIGNDLGHNLSGRADSIVCETAFEGELVDYSDVRFRPATFA